METATGAIQPSYLQRRVRLLHPSAVHQRAAALRRRRQQLRELDTPAQHQLVERLRDEIRDLNASATLDGPYWKQRRAELSSLILRTDPRRFLTWRGIRATMFVGTKRPHVERELATLRASREWSQTWSDALVEDAAGCPAPYPSLPTSSGNLIHHAFHCHALAQALSRPVASFDHIFEYGCGYGSFARLVYTLGFQGRYHAYDLPEFRALQRYYIASVAELRGSGFDGFASAAEPVPGGENSLFVALWSLSETPIANREPWVEVMRGYSNLMFGYTRQFEGEDNREWFQGLEARLPEFQWVRPTPGTVFASRT